MPGEGVRVRVRVRVRVKVKVKVRVRVRVRIGVRIGGLGLDGRFVLSFIMSCYSSHCPPSNIHCLVCLVLS